MRVIGIGIIIITLVLITAEFVYNAKGILSTSGFLQSEAIWSLVMANGIVMTTKDRFPI
jgi:hypothetical protein